MYGNQRTNGEDDRQETVDVKVLRDQYRLVELDMRLLETAILNSGERLPRNLWWSLRGHFRTVDDLGSIIRSIR